jgi:antitoxin (DNA-binding transcriptional repressor) of toxin-antitoxin stability system
MKTVTLQEAQANLPELIGRIAAGEELVITDNGRPVARLARPLREIGKRRGTVLYMAPDFDAPLDDFREYTG